MRRNILSLARRAWTRPSRQPCARSERNSSENTGFLPSASLARRLTLTSVVPRRLGPSNKMATACGHACEPGGACDLLGELLEMQADSSGTMTRDNLEALVHGLDEGNTNADQLGLLTVGILWCGLLCAPLALWSGRSKLLTQTRIHRQSEQTINQSSEFLLKHLTHATKLGVARYLGQPETRGKINWLDPSHVCDPEGLSLRSDEDYELNACFISTCVLLLKAICFKQISFFFQTLIVPKWIFQKNRLNIMSLSS